MRPIDFTSTQVASSRTIRDINRSVVLNLIRRRQPISRADLARASGLQRSTVSQITHQLIREKWVVHGPVGRLPRGRHPTFLRLNDHRAMIVIDLRPHVATVAIADVNGKFLTHDTIPVTRDSEVTTAALIAKLQLLMQVHTNLVFDGVGMSLPGRVSEKTQRLVFAPNLGWHDFDLKAAIERATGLPAELENAANACVLAEIWFGSAEKTRDLIVVTISEGVGVGIFSNGRLSRGSNGMAGEFGHVSIDPSGPRCSCGGRGCWEVYASNRAALRYYSELTSTAQTLTFQDLLALVEAGDALAGEAVKKMVAAIGRGLRMIVAGLAPEEILVVGDLTRHWQRFGSALEAEVAADFFGKSAPRVRPAEGGDLARLRGTVALVLQKHFGPMRRSDFVAQSAKSGNARIKAANRFSAEGADDLTVV